MGILVYIILLIIFIVVYFEIPISIQLILFVVNIFIPDPIPYIDEVIMAAVIIKKIMSNKNIY